MNLTLPCLEFLKLMEENWWKAQRYGDRSHHQDTDIGRQAEQWAEDKFHCEHLNFDRKKIKGINMEQGKSYRATVHTTTTTIPVSWPIANWPRGNRAMHQLPPWKGRAQIRRSHFSPLSCSGQNRRAQLLPRGRPEALGVLSLERRGLWADTIFERLWCRRQGIFFQRRNFKLRWRTFELDLS